MVRPSAFDRACHELFEGWSRVSTHAEHNGYHVRLFVSDVAMAAARWDQRALLARLFRRSKLSDLAERIEANQQNMGLRRYGRKRRA